jgi:DNA-binding NarL/FixJ family response regulator
MSEHVRVLLADDHPPIRAGLRAALQVTGDLQVVGEAVDGPTVLELCRELEPDVLVLDLRMPGPAPLRPCIRCGRSARRRRCWC